MAPALAVATLVISSGQQKQTCNGKNLVTAYIHLKHVSGALFERD